MKKILGIFMLVVCTAVAALAEDHHDNAPIQVGYAVITPTAGGTNGLIAFETFGLRNGVFGTASQAGVLPPGLTLSSMLFVNTDLGLGRNLGVALVNPNSVDVTVSMTLRRADGTQAATTNVTVPKLQQIAKFITEVFSGQNILVSDFTGTVVITVTGPSPLPISITGLRFRGTNFSTLPATSLIPATTPLPVIATGVGGPNAILLPQFAADGGWGTQVVMTNTGTSAMTVRLDLFKSNGAALSATLNGTTASSFTNLSIPPGGILVFAPRDDHGDDDF